MSGSTSKHPGIHVRHQIGCGTSEGRRCSCRPRYRAEAYSSRDGKKLRKTFSTLAEAKLWRADAQLALRKGTVAVAPRITVRQAADEWLDGARAGTIRNRSGDRYKPSAVRGYEQALRLRIIPAFGPRRLGELRRADLQDLVDRLLKEGHGPSTIRNTLLPLRAIFRRAVARGEVALNPTRGLELPAVRARRDRIASPTEAAALLSALSADRALWATAMYAGLRLGELRALEWRAIDLKAGVIRVERSWDQRAGPVAPKSRAGRRVVPIASVLRAHLAEHRLAVGARSGLVFGRRADVPFHPNSVNDRAQRAWRKAQMKRITLHECRHTFASLMIAAGVNAKALSTYIGHASVTITFDLYGHLMPGNEAEAAGLLDAYLLRAQGPSAQVR